MSEKQYIPNDEQKGATKVVPFLLLGQLTNTDMDMYNVHILA